MCRKPFKKSTRGQLQTIVTKGQKSLRKGLKRQSTKQGQRAWGINERRKEKRGVWGVLVGTQCKDGWGKGVKEAGKGLVH